MRVAELMRTEVKTRERLFEGTPVREIMTPRLRVIASNVPSFESQDSFMNAGRSS